jgi:hypothetical protein
MRAVDDTVDVEGVLRHGLVYRKASNEYVSKLCISDSAANLRSCSASLDRMRRAPGLPRNAQSAVRTGALHTGALRACGPV